MATSGSEAGDVSAWGYMAMGQLCDLNSHPTECIAWELGKTKAVAEIYFIVIFS